MLEVLLPKDIVPYLEYLPDGKVVINTLLPLAPLYTYGTTCWGIHKRKSSVGYSIDICATMIISSILRILYYFVSPYEKSLLRQSIVMIVIQCILLKVSLSYRPRTYNPEMLGDSSAILTKLSTLPPVFLIPALESDSVCAVTSDVLKGYFIRSWHYCIVWFQYFLAFFDVHYRRPGYFWQWSLERRYWRFLQVFVAFFTTVTFFFHGSSVYAVFLGTLGLFIEALLPLPQIMMIHRLQSVENFKVILLISWLSGDCLKLSYLFYGTDEVLVLFFLAAFFQMGLDLIILYQYIKYSQSAEESLPMFYNQGVEMQTLPSNNF